MRSLQVALLTSPRYCHLPAPQFFFSFFFFFLQAPILTGITGFTARPIETLSRVAVKLAAPYSAFHYG